ncbi:uncharacterized protein LOC110095207 [Dendrobium catenatum]|uniref:uncharacterized protein LOC110095207 n=1 Tax=Dendrobium catenatum TaxID=906689 RepID=UPI0009F37349|nr:uncharacterized protein LOC110095207 [Dendrobium catenatum]
MPKPSGGLGITTIESLYYAFGCSLIWRYYNIKSYLYTWWKENYVSFWNTGCKRSTVYWKFLCEVARKLPETFKFNINDSSSLSFFWEPWCSSSSVAERLKSKNLDHLITPQNLAVSSLISTGNWNLPPSIPPNLAAIIKAIPITSSLANCGWHNKEKPNFKSFIKSYFSDCPFVPWFKHVWHKHFALHFSTCCWMAFKHKLKTVDILLTWGILVNPICSFCHLYEENHNHLFFECNYTFQILKKVFPCMTSMLFRPNLGQVFCHIDDRETDISRKNYCFLLLCATVYYIWRAWNDRIFGNSVDCHSTILANIKRAIACYLLLTKNVHLLEGLLWQPGPAFLKDDDDSNNYMIPLDGHFGNQGSFSSFWMSFAAAESPTSTLILHF